MIEHKLPCTFDCNLSNVIVNAYVGMALAHIQSHAHLDRVIPRHEAARTRVVCIPLNCTE